MKASGPPLQLKKNVSIPTISQSSGPTLGLNSKNRQNLEKFSIDTRQVTLVKYKIHLS